MTWWGILLGYFLGAMVMLIVLGLCQTAKTSDN